MCLIMVFVVRSLNEKHDETNSVSDNGVCC